MPYGIIKYNRMNSENGLFMGLALWFLTHHLAMQKIEHILFGCYTMSQVCYFLELVCAHSHSKALVLTYLQKECVCLHIILRYFMFSVCVKKKKKKIEGNVQCLTLVSVHARSSVH